MTRILVTIVLTAGLTVLSAAAQPAAARPSATQPAHPALPPGHPAMGGMSGALPAGHPTMGGMSAGQAGVCPAGMGRVAPATTQPAKNASISIRAVQGIKGGPKVAGDKVTVELDCLYRGSRTQPIRIQTTLDAHGAAVLKGKALDLDEPFQPRVIVHHAGGDFEAFGAVLNAAHTADTVEVKVYQTTLKEPEWHIVRHVIVGNARGGIRVSDWVIVDNPSDRAWLAGQHGAKSLVLPLPHGAQSVQLTGDVPPGGAKLADGKIVLAATLVPGMTRYALAYVLPATKRQVRVDLTAPAPVDRVMVFLPDDGTKVSTEGLESTGKVTVPAGLVTDKPMPARMFQAGPLKKGQKVGFTVAGLLPALQEPREASATSGTVRTAALAGGGALLALALVVLVIRRPGARKTRDGEAKTPAPRQAKSRDSRLAKSPSPHEVEW